MPSSRPTFPLHGWNSRSINVTNRSLYHFEGTTLAERCKVDNNTMAQGPLRLTTSQYACTRVNRSSNSSCKGNCRIAFHRRRLIQAGRGGGGEEAITNKVSPPGESSLPRVPAELSNGKLFYACGRDIDTVCDATEMCINAIDRLNY